MKKNIPAIIVHVIGWILFLSLPVVFVAGDNKGDTIVRFLSSPAYLEYFLFFCGVFYMHTYLLLPRLYFGRKKLWYFFLVTALLLLTISLKPFDRLTFQSRSFNQPTPLNNLHLDLPQPPFEPGSLPPSRFDHEQRGPGMQRMAPPQGLEGRRIKHIDIVSLFLYLLILAMGVALESSRRLSKTEKKLILTESEKTRAELSFLKAQINPHFLFNTLNNIYSLALLKNERTPDAIMKLSNIMRYVTDEAHADYVLLTDELDCIADYIYLHELGFGKKVQMHFQVTGEPEGKRIAPLLLMTFIENVFKHGLSNHEVAALYIGLVIEGDQLVFSTKNKIFPANQIAERTGQGIANAEKRLQLLYPGKHVLKIEKANGCYMVEIILQLNN